MVLHSGIVREKCKQEVIRTELMSLELFGRIPMFYFNYFMTPNILEHECIDYIAPFMLINKIPALLMSLFYACGNDDSIFCIETYNVFQRIWNYYNTIPKEEYIAYFGDNFVLRLNDRTLCRIDESIVNCPSKTHEYFVPNTPNWKTLRQIRIRTRQNQFRIDDDLDLENYRQSRLYGLSRQGRYNANQQNN